VRPRWAGVRGMALSSGTRQALAAVAGWIVVAGSAALSLAYFAEIKGAARGLFGIEAASLSASPSARREGLERAAEPVRTLAAGRTFEIRAGAHGHYYARAEINGRQIDVLVDSGASIVALTWEDAERAGLHIRDSDFTQRVSTANGVARVAPVMLDRVSLGDIVVRNVQAAVSQRGNLATSLLGMSFLSRLQRVDMRSGVLVLQE